MIPQTASSRVCSLAYALKSALTEADHNRMSHGEPTTCLVADDHPAVVEAVADVLGENGIEIAGRARDGHEAVDQIESSRPDVALLDLRMPGLSGIEVARQVGRSSPDTAVILYTAFGDRALLTEAMDAGARGFVLKEAPLAEVVRAVELVAAGRTYVDPARPELLPLGADRCRRGQGGDRRR